MGFIRLLLTQSLKKGNLKVGELLIKGKLKKEILFSTYLCHPSMANNEISGLVVATNLAKWLKKQKLKYTYRILFLPETIGSIAYLSKKKDLLIKNTIGGYVLTCIGDNRNFSLLESKNKNSLSNIVAKFILKSKKMLNFLIGCKEEVMKGSFVLKESIFLLLLL